MELATNVQGCPLAPDPHEVVEGRNLWELLPENGQEAKSVGCWEREVEEEMWCFGDIFPMTNGKFANECK